MNVYEPEVVLASISDHAAAVVVVGGLSILAMFVFFIEAARAGQRDRVYPMALWMTALWFPHDWSYLFHAPDWFGGVHSHWFMQLFWFAIIVTALAETFYAWQTVRYGRDQLSPGHSQLGHAVRMGGVLVAGIVSWALVKGALQDDLYLLSFMATLLWGAPSGHATLSRYPDGRGQAQSTWYAYSVMTVCYSVTSIAWFGGGFFHSWQYIGICVVASIWSFVLIVDVRRAGVPMSASSPVAQPTAASRPSTSAPESHP